MVVQLVLYWLGYISYCTGIGNHCVITIGILLVLLVLVSNVVLLLALVQL